MPDGKPGSALGVEGPGKGPGEPVRLVDHDDVSRIGDLDEADPRGAQTLGVLKDFALAATDEGSRDREPDQQLAHRRDAAGDQADGAAVDRQRVAEAERGAQLGSMATNSAQTLEIQTSSV